MAKHEELIEKLFLKYVKPMGLPPRLAGEIKHAMEAAAKSSKGDSKETKKAIKSYLIERKYDPETGKKLPKEKKGKKAKKAKKAVEADSDDEPKKKKAKKGDADPAKEKLEKAGAKKALKGDDAGTPAGNIDLRKLNRQTMKGMAKDFELGYKKKWTDDELRVKLAKHMIGVDDKVTAKIKDMDANKIEALPDCIGVLLDLSKAICITCPAQTDCRKIFEQHRADGFKVFDNLAPGSTQIDPTVVPATSLKKKSPLPKPVDAFNADRKIEVYDFGKVKDLPAVKVDDVQVASNMEHKALLRDLKESVPETLGEFRDVVLKHYNADEKDTDSAKLTMWFARYCTALEVMKLI